MVQWASTAQLFHIYEDPTYYKITSWLTMWAWLFAACAFMFIVIILTVSRMFSAFVETSKLSTFSEYAVDWDNNTAVSISSDRKKQIRSVIFRVMLYPTVPIITQVWVLAANMTLECPMWLYVVANIVPASQGIINFLIFITNPAWDSHRYQLYRRISSSGATKKASPNSSSTGFAKLDIEAGSCHSPRSAATLKF
ncbi:hypothetical protein GGI02_003031 [Coemansia sp. RSA 2322]|nr:hypothetical protein GGI02_003031 [Coemansia sp. RSA 2322]